MLRELKTGLEQSVEVHLLVIDETASTVTSEGELITPEKSNRAFQAAVTGAGAVAVVDIEVSCNGTDWQPFITLYPKENTPDGTQDFCPWPFTRAKVQANTGTLNVTVEC